MNIVACLLPFLVGCGWFALLTARRNKTLAMHVLAFMALLGGLYFLFDAIVMLAAKDFDETTIVYASLINTLVGPLLPLAAICFFLSQVKREQHASPRWFLVLIPYICYSFVAFIVTQALGVGKAGDFIVNNHMMPGQLLNEEAFAYKTYEFVVFDIFRWVMIFNFSILLIAIIYTLAISDFKPKVIYRFFFQGGPIRPCHVVAVLFVILMAQSYYRFSDTGLWMVSGSAIAANLIYVVKAVTLFLIGFFGYHAQKPAIYLVNKHNTPQFDDMPTLKTKTDWRDESGEDEYSLPILQSDFYELMRDQQCYRRPGLNIYSVASELGVTANALNHMVKSVYGVNYNTYIKVQRVAFARRYHQHFPDLPAETVAMESGFSSANMMRQNFKEAAYVIQKIAE